MQPATNHRCIQEIEIELYRMAAGERGKTAKAVAMYVAQVRVAMQKFVSEAEKENRLAMHVVDVHRRQADEQINAMARIKQSQKRERGKMKKLRDQVSTLLRKQQTHDKRAIKKATHKLQAQLDAMMDQRDHERSLHQEFKDALRAAEKHITCMKKKAASEAAMGPDCSHHAMKKYLDTVVLAAMWTCTAKCIKEVLQEVVGVMPEAWAEPGHEHQRVHDTMEVAKTVIALVNNCDDVRAVRRGVLNMVEHAKDAANKGEVNIV